MREREREKFERVRKEESVLLFMVCGMGTHVHTITREGFCDCQAVLTNSTQSNEAGNKSSSYCIFLLNLTFHELHNIHLTFGLFTAPSLYVCII
mgnify:CR=1 FL=1